MQGVRSFVNGNKYIGKFFNGVIEGGGIMSFANGLVTVSDNASRNCN